MKHSKDEEGDGRDARAPSVGSGLYASGITYSLRQEALALLCPAASSLCSHQQKRPTIIEGSSLSLVPVLVPGGGAWASPGVPGGLASPAPLAPNSFCVSFTFGVPGRERRCTAGAAGLPTWNLNRHKKPAFTSTAGGLALDLPEAPAHLPTTG